MGQLIGRRAFQVAKAFARTRIIEPDGLADEPDTFEEIEGADGNAFQCFHRLLKRKGDRGLTSEIVDFVRLDLGQDLQNTAKIVHGQAFQTNLVLDPESLQIPDRRHLSVSGRPTNLVAET